jgi:hypothetical protein
MIDPVTEGRFDRAMIDEECRFLGLERLRTLDPYYAHCRGVAFDR